MKSFFYAILLGGLMLPVAAWGQSFERKVFSNGGGAGTIGANIFAYTFGEPMVGTDQSNLPYLTKGFHQPLPDNLLPQGLQAFAARWTGEQVALSWVHPEAQAWLTFQIERSLDQFSFVSIQEISPREQAYYQSLDQEARHFAGQTVYYRLRLLGKDGQFRLSKVEAVAIPWQALLPWTLAPNPARQHTVLRGYSSESSLHIRLINAQGQLVFQHDADRPNQQAGISIPLHTLASGWYQLTAWQGNKRAQIPLIIP